MESMATIHIKTGTEIKFGFVGIENKEDFFLKQMWKRNGYSFWIFLIKDKHFNVNVLKSDHVVKKLMLVKCLRICIKIFTYYLDLH